MHNKPELYDSNGVKLEAGMYLAEGTIRGRNKFVRSFLLTDTSLDVAYLEEVEIDLSKCRVFKDLRSTQQWTDSFLHPTTQTPKNKQEMGLGRKKSQKLIDGSTHKFNTL